MADYGKPQPSDEVCNFFWKPSKNRNIRKRTLDDDQNTKDNEKSDGPFSLIHKLKKPPNTDNKLHFSTVQKSKSRESYEEETENTHVFHFESSIEIQVQHDSRATATLETETDFFGDTRAIRERVFKRKSGDEKIYRGIHGYTDYKVGFRREHTVSGEKAGGAHGPLRVLAHVRSSTRFDYQPDICKDYKERGYCGFGDACKFMHDRGDYKSGWQMEREWDEAEKVRKRNLALGR